MRHASDHQACLTRHASRFAVLGLVLGLASGLGTVVTLLPPESWLGPAANWRGLSPVVLLYSTLLLLAAAPVVGVRAATGRRDTGAPRRGLDIVASLTAWTGAFVGAAAALGALVGWAANESPSPVPVSAYLVQAIAGFTIATASALVRLRVRDDLDAAGLAVCATAIGSVGILFAGVWVDRVPRAVAEWAVGGSPLMAVARAADIDLMRTDVLYQISPLAHLSLELPHSSAVTWAYGTSALLCSAVLWRHGSRHRRPLGATPLGKDLL